MQAQAPGAELAHPPSADGPIFGTASRCQQERMRVSLVDAQFAASTASVRAGKR